MKKLPNTGIWVPDKETWYNEFFASQSKSGQYTDWEVREYQKDNVLHACSVCLTDRRNYAIDIGANIGLISMQLAYKFGNVLAIEPRPDTFECLERNTVKYNQISCLHSAVGNQTGIIEFTGDIKDCAHSHVDTNNTDPYPEMVPITKLDDLQLEGCDLIKIDTEGYELEVITGALATIEKWKPVIILEELSFFRKDNAIKLHQQYGPDFVNLHRRPRRILEDMGYEIYSRQGHDFVLARPADYL